MAAADKPKLFYYDATGLGEITRLLFVYTGKEFEDVRFNREEWLSKYKDESPLGMAPFFEEGGNKLGGSLAIARYVAEQNGLGGGNAFENALLDSYGDAMLDVLFKLHPLKIGPEDKRDDARKELLTSLPAKFSFIDKQIKGEDTFIAGKVTWPDIQLSYLCYELNNLKIGEVVKDCPKIQKVIARIDSNDKIKAWRKARSGK